MSAGSETWRRDRERRALPTAAPSAAARKATTTGKGPSASASGSATAGADVGRDGDHRHEVRFAGIEIPSKSAWAAKRNDGNTGAAVNSSVVLWTVTPVGDV